MIIENLLARVNELEFDLHTVKERLARVEEVVASLRAQTATGARTVTETKPVTSTAAAAKSPR